MEKASGAADFFVSIYSHDSALSDFLANGFDVFVATTALGYGYSSRTNLDAKDDCLRMRASNLATDTGWTLEDFSRFRICPFKAKQRLATIFELGHSSGTGIDREWMAYPCLAHASLGETGRPVFLFLHTNGVHEPVWIDREGKWLPAKDDSYAGHIEMEVFVLRQLGKLFDVFREKGIYDNSCILVLGDHGNRIGGDAKGLSGLARPFLWVKPFGKTQPFDANPAPTSHARIADLLEAEANADLDPSDVVLILSTNTRRFHQIEGNTFHDILVEDDGSYRVEEG